MKEEAKNKALDKMITEAVHGRFSFFIWLSIDGVVEKCETKIKAVRKEYKEIELSIEPDQEAQLVKVIPGNRIVNIFVPELSISFSSTLKAISIDKKIKIYIPTDYIFYNRRRYERVRFVQNGYVSFEQNKIMIKKILYDISAGGFSLVILKTDPIARKMDRGLILFLLEIAGKKIKVKAECVNNIKIDRHKLEDLPYGGVKLGFRFAEMSKEDKEFLIELVKRESMLLQVSKKAN